MSKIIQEGGERQYHVTNLLIADAIARTSGNSRVAAIMKCARKIRSATTDKKVFDLAGRIIKERSSDRIIDMIDDLLIDCVQAGVLPPECSREL